MPLGVICRGCKNFTQEAVDGRCPDCRKRHGAIRNARPSHAARLAVPKAQRLRVYRRDDFICVYCGSAEDLTLDHVQPLVYEIKKRYADSELVTACRSCNSRRGGALSCGGRGAA